MAQFIVDIPDELLPALIAEFSLVQGSTSASTPEEYFAASVVETVRQRAELYKVGPYYRGPVNPVFREDGKPYGWVDPDPVVTEGEDVPPVDGGDGWVDPDPVVTEGEDVPPVDGGVV